MINVAPFKPGFRFLTALVLSAAAAQAASPEPLSLYAMIERAVADRVVAGAQVVVGEGDSPLVARSFGVCDVRNGRLVDDDTRFCIGSCSKMFAGAVLASMASQKKLELDTPVDRWLKFFTAPRLADGRPARRAPTVRELLRHEGGIYSQHDGMTPAQRRWIRDFSLSLADSVAGIAREPLSSEPGTAFSYSGAGYCVGGRVAEVAAGKPFEQLLLEHVVRPLELPRTTYFPPSADVNIALGHVFRDGRVVVARSMPHLYGPRHRLALVGGSIYAPAREVAEFARMLLRKGKGKRRPVLTPAAWREMVRTGTTSSDAGYGFGLSVIAESKTGDPQSVSHSGELGGSFCRVAVDYQTGRFGVVQFTGKQNAEINNALNKWVRSAAESF